MTPMMQQYFDIKQRNPGCILFFRLGDFYEMFDEDARVVSKELDLALTTRDRKAEAGEQIPMCGFPHHSADSNIARLIAKGYKVAICEQLEDPKEAKGLVERDVIRLITPGTLMDSSMLDEGKANYICSIHIGSRRAAACFCDLSTGEISVTEFEPYDIRSIENELASYAPSEALLSGDDGVADSLAQFLKSRFGCPVQKVDGEGLCGERVDDTGSETANSDSRERAEGLCATLKSDSAAPLSAEAALATNELVTYLTETQKSDISHFQPLRRNNDAAYMEMDINAIRNLELVGSLRTSDRKSGLLWVLDKTKTSMGRRLMRSWVLRPLLSIAPILRRQGAVSELVGASVARGELINSLKGIGDIERLIGKIAYGNANCRDMRALADSIRALPSLTAELGAMESAAMREHAAMDTLFDIAELIEGFIVDAPPLTVREGGIIRDGADGEVDRLRALLSGSKQTLLDIESRERERTGKKVKVSSNSVFGYYIELPRSVSDDVPADYVRKQTLTNCERFITQELKELETELFSAEDNLAAREYTLYEQLRAQVAEAGPRIQKTAGAVAELDALCSFAEVAVLRGYCRPEIEPPGVIEIKDGRHPVVEVMLDGSLFVPNDTLLDAQGNRTVIITGPNMAGKSTYMRQTALITLMAQMGSFVPARSARIGIVDRVFTRIGASDDIASGQSTFMVEMNEVADILSSATKNSLLILDEIGRGTSTFDGMSVARAVLEHCADKRRLGAKTMFATHYHELAMLEGEADGVKNYNISAKKRGDDIIFLRKIIPGSADDSYGIEVAGLAGVPDSVISRAKAVLAELEAGSAGAVSKGAKNDALNNSDGQMSLMDMGSSEIVDKLRYTDLNTLTPLEALSLLFEMKKLLD